jgi:hypothetical protein
LLGYLLDRDVEADGAVEQPVELAFCGAEAEFFVA